MVVTFVVQGYRLFEEDDDMFQCQEATQTFSC